MAKGAQGMGRGSLNDQKRRKNQFLGMELLKFLVCEPVGQVDKFLGLNLLLICSIQCGT